MIDGRTHRLSLAVEPLLEADAWLEEQRGRWERLFGVVEGYPQERG